MEHFQHNYIVVKPVKSVGISIILTLVLGPIGLFYSTITGGIVMTFLPFFLVIAALAGFTSDSSHVSILSLGGLVIYALFWWLICIIWGVISVNQYNDEIIRNARPVNKSETTNLQPNSNLQAWLHQNPSKGINDYYQQLHSKAST